MSRNSNTENTAERTASGSVPPSPRTGSAAAPVSLPGTSNSTILSSSSRSARGINPSLLLGQFSSSLLEHSTTTVAVAASTATATAIASASSPRSSSASSPLVVRRRRSSGDQSHLQHMSRSSNSSHRHNPHQPPVSPRRSLLMDSVSKAQSRSARKLNDSMVYLDGPQIYTCAQCRTHLTSHDEIISKSFHGRHGRAYLFDHCVNVSIGPAEDRLLITGLHSVCDIFCKRCKNLVGWTYAKAYESSQKYKEGKFIVEKINLHLEESDYYDVAPPAGERKDRFRARSISWGSERGAGGTGGGAGSGETIYEYRPSNPISSPPTRPTNQDRPASG